MENKLKPQAVNLLKRAKEQILNHPETYEHGHWCGSVCCIAGHVCAISGVPQTQDNGVKLLGIPEAAHLFMASRIHGIATDEEAADMWGHGWSESPCPQEKRAKTAAIVIDRFIAKHT